MAETSTSEEWMVTSVSYWPQLITIPIRTVSEANTREHWATKARRVKRQRGVVMAMLRSKIGKPPALPVTVRLTRIAPRALDDDNLRGALKAPRDSVADWLGLPNDRDRRCTWEYEQRRGDPKQYAVEILVCMDRLPVLEGKVKR